jgi:hypothetical protein
MFDSSLRSFGSSSGAKSIMYSVMLDVQRSLASPIAASIPEDAVDVIGCGGASACSVGYSKHTS